MSPPGGAVVNVKCVKFKLRGVGVCSFPYTLALQGLISTSLSTFALLVVDGGCSRHIGINRG
jgi:hypothetical protein